MPDIFLTSEIEAILAIPNLVTVVHFSGGKDSECALIALQDHYRQTETAADIRLAWADTGNEWRDDAEGRWVSSQRWVIQRSAHHRLPLTIVRNSKRTLPEEIIERGRFPSNKNRWCTSHHKRGPLEKYLRSIITNNPEADFILSVKGIRADESDQRAQKDPWEIHPKLTVRRATRTGRPRYCWNWLPIFYWTLDDVLAYVEEKEIELHPGYAIKDRFSCQWCIYDGPKQIAAIYKHNRPAYDECHALELQTNWTLSSDRKFLPEVLADYEASGKRWIPPTAVYTRNAICDY